MDRTCDRSRSATDGSCSAARRPTSPARSTRPARTGSCTAGWRTCPTRTPSRTRGLRRQGAAGVGRRDGARRSRSPTPRTAGCSAWSACTTCGTWTTRPAAWARSGFWVVGAERGHGVSTDAVRLVCRYGFDELRLARIEWQAEVGNCVAARWPRRSASRRGHLPAPADPRAATGWTAGSPACCRRTCDDADGALTGADLPSDDLPDVAPVLQPTGCCCGPGRTTTRTRWSCWPRTPTRAAGRRRCARSTTCAGAQAWIDGRLARRTDWAVRRRATGRLAGAGRPAPPRPDDGVCEIGYGVMAAARRRGVAGRALEAVLAYAFAPRPHGLGRHRVNLQHVLGNVASCRVAWAHGFAFEGVARGVSPTATAATRRCTCTRGSPPTRRGRSRRVVPAEPVEIAAGPYQLCVPDPAVDAAAVARAHATRRSRSGTPARRTSTGPPTGSPGGPTGPTGRTRRGW